MDDLVGTRVLLNVHECADTTNIVTTGHIHSSAVFEFNNTVDLASLKVKLENRKSIKYNSFQKKERRAQETLTLTESFFLMSGWG